MNLPNYIPELLPDQTLYSWTAMFHYLTGAASASETCRTLFGAATAGRHFHIPTHLDYLSAQTQSVLGSVEEIVATSTIIPFYTQFRPSRIAREVLAKVRGTQNAGLIQTLGIYKIGKQSLPLQRACIECIQEDQEKYGYRYWHVAHQLPCTLVCHKHGTMLIGVRTSHVKDRRSPFATPRVPQIALAQDVSKRIRTNEHDQLDRLAQIAKNMLVHRQTGGWNRDRLKQVFLTEIKDRNVWYAEQMLDPHKLELDFFQHFRDLVEVIELAPAIQQRGIYSVWCLIEGVERIVHPEDWVIAIEWIFGSWERFMNKYQSLPTP